MGIRFVGFFTKCKNIEIAEKIKHTAKITWSEVKIKIMTEPCLGIALKMTDLVEDYIEQNCNETENNEISQEEVEKLLEKYYSIESNLPEWSQKFPEQKFVYLDSDCFGGICLEEGFVCKNGEKIFTQELQERGLKNLLKYGEIQNSWNFKPLTRGYFD